MAYKKILVVGDRPDLLQEVGYYLARDGQGTCPVGYCSLFDFERGEESQSSPNGEQTLIVTSATVLRNAYQRSVADVLEAMASRSAGIVIVSDQVRTWATLELGVEASRVLIRRRTNKLLHLESSKTTSRTLANSIMELCGVKTARSRGATNSGGDQRRKASWASSSPATGG